MMELIRYADEGFVSYPQNKEDVSISGCHCFAMIEDEYMFTGIASQRPLQKRNVMVIEETVEVWTRNLYYYTEKNEYGYTMLCCDTWDETKPSWIKVPLWWVKENIQVILNHEGSCVGYFATDVILEC